MRRIFLLEDDQNLVAQAQAALATAYQFNEVLLSEGNSVLYWTSLGLTANDLPVLDLNLKSGYSGKDVLRLLEREKRKGTLNGLEQVVVATSMKQEISPGSVNPDIALLDGFKVYGLEKGKEGGSYGSSLAAIIETIYAGIAKPLNE